MAIISLTEASISRMPTMPKKIPMGLLKEWYFFDNTTPTKKAVRMIIGKNIQPRTIEEKRRIYCRLTSVTNI